MEWKKIMHFLISSRICINQGKNERQVYIMINGNNCFRGKKKISSVQLLSHVLLFATHRLQHTRPPCPSQTPRVYSNSCPLSQWCHPTISSSVIPFFSCPQTFSSIRVFSNELALRIKWPKYWNLSFNISPSMNTQNWSPLGETGWISLQSKRISRVFSNTTVQKHQLFNTQLSL